MAFSEELESKIINLTSDWRTTRKKMFGGTCHLINGNMMCGVYRNYLVLRLGEHQARESLGRPHVKPFDITGKPMKGWVMVSEEGFAGPALAFWLQKAREFVKSLPPK